MEDEAAEAYIHARPAHQSVRHTMPSHHPLIPKLFTVFRSGRSCDQFFAAGYPDMHSVEQNAAAAEAAGYRVLATHTLPPETWIDGYYDVLEPRSQTLIKRDDAAVREFAEETLKEIEILRRSEGSFGYVFYILQILQHARM